MYVLFRFIFGTEDQIFHDVFHNFLSNLNKATEGKIILVVFIYTFRCSLTSTSSILE